MAISRVIPPTDKTADYDYIAFIFDGKHSYEDFGLVRTGDGDRYNEELLPTAQDTTAEVTGGDGTYFFNTRHKQKVFNISFAFDGLNDAKIREMKQWLNGKKIADLWFAENPYKVYSAKVTGQPNIKFIPFDDYNASGQKVGRIYKGEGSVTFTCYWPYAHTPDYIGATGTANGKDLDSYTDADFNNKTQWAAASGLTNSTGVCMGENPGDLPAPFITTISYDVPFKLIVGDCYIECNGHEEHITWDSKTGLLYTDGGEVLSANGLTCGAIPTGGTNNIEIYFKHNDNWLIAYKVENQQWVLKNTDIHQQPGQPNCEIKYHYWYY